MTEQTIPDEQKPDERRSSWGKIGIFISTLALVIFVCGFGYGYFQLSQVNISLAENVSDLQRRYASTQEQLDKTQTALTALQQAAQKSEDLSKQQEQMMTEWKSAQQGNLNKWHVAEAQYLVKLANDHLQFDHDVPLAISLLQRADQELANSQDADSLQIRKSIAANIANLQAAPKVDITAIYLKLSGLNSQVDQLPLPVSPLAAEEKPATPLPADASWWQSGWQKTMDALHKIVIVRYNTSNTLPLALPDEKAFLYQNLHAQFEQAMLALLNRNAAIYEASLARAQDWVKQYFVSDAEVSKAMQESLNDLRKTTIQPADINLGDTLKLFDASLTAQNPQQPDQAVKQ